MPRARALSVDVSLEELWERKGTDLHLTVGAPPLLRIDGELVPLEVDPLTAADTDAAHDRPRVSTGASRAGRGPTSRGG